MRNKLARICVTLFCLGIPAAALADLTGKPTLLANTSLNLDNGTTSSSGGDILWDGAALTPQGKAGAFNIGLIGATGFAGLNQSALALLPGYTQTPLPASTLVTTDVFAVKTNGGNYAIVLVISDSSGALSLQFTTFGSAAASGPIITNILNNFGLVPAGFPNSGIAPGALFVIAGSGLADPAASVVLQSSSNGGIPTTLNGASVKVTVNGTTTVPGIYYAIAAQLAVVLPSNTPVGTGSVTVTYNGQTSVPFSIQVAQSAMGFDSYYGTGSGLGVATNAVTGALYNYSNSIPPGTNIVLWGSGLGADPARDTKYVPAAFSINNLAHVYIGGVDAAILYQGASGFPGVNQVNVTVPLSSPTGCNVPLAGVTAGGVPSNFTTLPIGTGLCSDPATGFSGGQFQTLSGQATVKTGEVIVAHSVVPATNGIGTQTTDVSLASFSSTTGSDFGAGSSSVSLGSGCIVNEYGSVSGGSTVTTKGLNAGTVTLSGPGGNATLMPLPQSTGTLYSQLTPGFIPTNGGTINVHGAGGTDVGSFDTSIVFSPPLFAWTNQSALATVTRSSGLPLTWTGGSPETFVVINGSASSSVASGSFSCLVPVAAGQFTVPAYVTGALPAGAGSINVANYTQYKPFSASGLDFAVSLGFVSFQINTTFN